ncbi:MFS transporter [Phenylobacterium montanum]|uniref:MFS transporter n=2 Tax=Phenylobacterium montanum TaxID=2823693 RepID=A0A975G4P0_9CAUL|nr:MFS transporter [Caulobacter sp. S6]
MPYFARVVVGDPVRGQAAVAAYGQYSGWIVMLTAPILGASIDRMGRRKPWLFVVVAAMIPLIALLWRTKADHSGLSVGAVIAIATTIGVLFSYTEVLHNSLLVRAAGLSGAHKASGLALALGNAFAVGALVFVMWAFALPGKVDWGFIPKAPLFGLNPATHEPDRVVAPIAAGLFALGALPLFLFTPDAERGQVPVLRALREGFGQLVSMVTSLKGHRDAMIFLLSRMFYVDGMTAILLFAGVYASGVMKWGALEMLAYGVILSILAVLGGFLGGFLDATIGPKRSVQLEICMTLIGVICMLGMGPEKILYFWPFDPAAHAPVWHGPMFRTLPEVIYLLIGFSNAVFITAHYASSRTLLTRLTPPEQTGAFFGVYALSGTATVWLGSSLVNLGTHLTHTQQGGFATIIGLLAIGFVGLLFVRGGDAVRS